MAIYSVINMDIVNSRKIHDRMKIQESLKEYFKNLHHQYKEKLVAPVTFTLGDEWQLVLRDIKETYNLFIKINSFLLEYNIEVYCGIGIGKISTEESNDTREMDGEAFIYAREALRSAKMKNTFYSKDLHTKDCRIVIMGDSALLQNRVQNTFTCYEDEQEAAITTIEDDLDYITIINTLIQNNEMLESKITTKQREIIELYEKHGSYSEVERNYPRFTKSSISHKLAASNYFLSVHNKKIIEKVLGEYHKALVR